MLSCCWFLLFHGCTFHSLPFFFPWQRERAAFSRSRLDEAAAEPVTTRIMFKPSGCSWVTAHPPSERSSHVVLLCVHRRTSDTLGIAPLERGRRCVSSLQDVGVFLSFQPRLLPKVPRSRFHICSVPACTWQKGAGAIYTYANL